MAWNEPGGNGGRDPWGNRGGRQGPPDLDEVLNKLKEHLSRYLGGGGPRPAGSSGGGDGGDSASGGGFAVGGLGVGLIAIIAVVVWIISGVYVVDPAERAVVLRFGSYVRTSDPGPHWAPRFIESVEKVNVAQIRNAEIGFRSANGGNSTTSVPHESLMLTGDENIIDIRFAVQYRVKDAPDYLFNVLDPDLTLRQVTESAVRQVVGQNGMDFILTTGRAVVAENVKTLIQAVLNNYRTGLQVTSVNMQDAQPPAQVQAAFFDAVKAREDQVRIINIANAYKADVVPKARGEATAIAQRAEGYRQTVVAEAQGETARFLKVLAQYRKAPAVTRTRLYLDSMSSVMDHSSKVLVDVKGGNNLMYLPLDRLLGQGGASAANTATGGSVGSELGPRDDVNTSRSRSETSGRTR